MSPMSSGQFFPWNPDPFDHFVYDVDLCLEELKSDTVKSLDEIGQNVLTSLTEANIRDYLQALPDYVTEFQSLKEFEHAIERFMEIRTRFSGLDHAFEKAAHAFLAYELQMLLDDKLMDQVTADEIVNTIDYLEFKLIIDSREVKTLPYSLGLFTHLTHLTINTFQVTEIPESIRFLTNLKYLDLGHNKLTDLSSSLACCTNLIFLSIQDNCFQKIPQICLSLNLQTLEISHNPIQDDPTHTNGLDHIKHVDVHRNMEYNRQKSRRIGEIDPQIRIFV